MLFVGDFASPALGIQGARGVLRVARFRYSGRAGRPSCRPYGFQCACWGSYQSGNRLVHKRSRPVWSGRGAGFEVGLPARACGRYELADPFLYLCFWVAFVVRLCGPFLYLFFWVAFVVRLCGLLLWS